MLFTPRAKGLGKDCFLKLKDQEEVTGIFCGEIYTFKQHWVTGKSLGECTGVGCLFCANDPSGYPSFRFRINFIVSQEKQLIAKIFEAGGEVYDTLASMDKKF